MKKGIILTNFTMPCFSLLKKEMDTPVGAESNMAHGNNVDESTLTNNDKKDNMQRGVIPANKTTTSGESVVQAFRADEIPGPGESLYLEENVTYEPTEHAVTVTNKEDPTALYEHAWE